jgi:hypothetical protein
MFRLANRFEFLLVGIGGILLFGIANAAQNPRMGADTSQRIAPTASNFSAAGRMTGGSVQRMPVMPTLPGGGNISVDVPSGDGGGGGGGVEPPKPPVEKCPDGSDKNSKYTVENCMSDVLSCVNNGALPNGLNDLFNEDMRNAIFNGMSLCYVQVSKCVTDVRINCKNIYNSSSDVWIDFNSRKVQPEYYSFVLRQTGLTPNQAENTCLLLDRNTYGSSFTAVSSNDVVTSEYGKKINAYNNQGDKKNPLGVDVNKGVANTNVDGKRGHYARWDAVAGKCLVRVAAYNKDSHIKNSWLFGALGDDKPAEVWKATGESFSCNKDLFGFSLMNTTSTVAVVGIGGGTLVGTGIGAIAGHGDQAFSCSNPSHLKQLGKELHESSTADIGTLNRFLDNDVNPGAYDITNTQCDEIVRLYNSYQQAKTVKCEGDECSNKNFVVLESDWTNNAGIFSKCSEVGEKCQTYDDLNREIQLLDSVFSRLEVIKGVDSNMLKSTLVGAGVGAAAGGLATAITAFVEKGNINCRIGDNLEKVSFGKSYSIGSLKDFYVKWNLNLPDTIMPTAQVVDCDSWKRACGTLRDLNQCAVATINYRPKDSSVTKLINSGCKVSGSVCIEDALVAESQGACEYE